MRKHSMKHHAQRGYFDEVMPTCFRGPVFWNTVSIEVFEAHVIT